MTHTTTHSDVIEEGSPAQEDGAVDGRRLLEENSLWEAAGKFFGYPTPWILGATALIGWIGRVWLGGWSLWDLAVAAAILLFWPLQEWLIHVFILHSRPVEVFGRRFDLDTAKKHRRHHAKPWRIDIMFIPLRAVLVALPIAAALWFWVAPSLELGFMGLAIYTSLSLTYEWTHYLVHTNYKPQTRFYRRLWKNHRLHHFKNEKFWYGVSMLSGDRILGTAPDFKEVETSDTCRTLGVLDDDE